MVVEGFREKACHGVHYLIAKGVQHLMPFVCACSCGVAGHSRGCGVQADVRRRFAALHAFYDSLPRHLTEKLTYRLYVEATARHRHLVVIRPDYRIEAFRCIGALEQGLAHGERYDRILRPMDD